MFQKIEQSRVFDGDFIKVEKVRYGSDSGSVIEREYIMHPGAVTVVPVDEQGRVYALWQFRAALGREIFEVCAGKRDVAGEDPAITAARELKEELGIVASEILHLGSFYNSPGFCDERTEMYLARGLTQSSPSPQSVEESAMRIASLELARTPKLVAEGVITDGKSIVSLLSAFMYLHGAGSIGG